MRRLLLYPAAVLIAVSCSNGATYVDGPPAAAGADTVTFADSTGSANPGRVHFNLVRSATSNVPSTADSAVIRIYNNTTGFQHYYGVKIPVVGQPTVVSAVIPADTGYVVNVIAFHDSDVIDAIGSTASGDSTITVNPAGGPTYTGTPVTVTMQRPPFAIGFSVSEGSHVTAGEHISVYSTIDAPSDVWTSAESTFGCALAPNGVCADFSYLALWPNTPGPFTLQATYFAEWGDHTFSVVSDPVSVTIDKGEGGIDITFNKHH